MARHPTHMSEPDEPATERDAVPEPPVAGAAAPPKEAPKPVHPARSGLLAALRNAGMTADQGEAVVVALDEYLVAGSKH